MKAPAHGLRKCSQLFNRRKIINQRLTRKFVGIFFALLVGGLMIAIFAVLIFSPQPANSNALTPDIAHLIRMSLIQAALSTAISLIVGIALAWSLNRLRFWGRSIIISLLATAIVAPGLVIALGLISVWGRAGWIADFADLFAFNWPGGIFGLFGIVLAHTVLNGAFAAHLLLARLSAIPAQKLKLAQSLVLAPWQRFAILDWPAISSALPSLASIIFLLTFTSFPIVLLLGGGPSNQTLEVAIYSAVRLDFDLKTAAMLALVQLGICVAIILPTLGSTQNFSNSGNTSSHHWPDRGIVKFIQIAILIIAIFGFTSPLLAVLQKGLGPEFFETITRPSFIKAAQNSLILGTISAAITLFVAIRIAMTMAITRSKIAKAVFVTPIFAYLVMPSVVLSLGFFIGSRNLGISNAVAAPMVLIIANVLLALPFVYAMIAPAIKSIHSRYDKQARALNLSGFKRWQLVERPLLGREIGLALALTFSFSLGDLGVISLFGTAEFSTLPWQMFRAMGAYRNNDAATIAAIMLLISMAVFLILPSLFNRSVKIAEN
ncbi:MAG: hypothetical protein L3J21_03700 [Devosiaceae bacterium]|nr:hypothetical protein [Devosiaceae bacterium]